MTVLAAEKEQLAALELRLSSGLDDEAEVEIVQQIQALKTGTEIRILEIQLDYARGAGNDALVRELEKVIDELKYPQAVGQRRERPRPDPETR